MPNSKISVIDDEQDNITRFSAEDMEKFYGEGPNGYVEKPISPEDFVKIVKDNL
jgi:hypothetical protein